jgi:hypothetical protein
MAEFQIKDISFKTRPMDLFKQIQVLRRIGPFVPDMIITYRAMEKGATPIDAAIVMGPDILKVFSAMKDEDVQYIVQNCLEIVQFNKGGEIWNPLMTSGRLNSLDVDLFLTGQIVWKVLEDNLRPFFLDLKALSPAGQTAAV